MSTRVHWWRTVRAARLREPRRVVTVGRSGDPAHPARPYVLLLSCGHEVRVGKVEHITCGQGWPCLYCPPLNPGIADVSRERPPAR